jgi:hypothetical protein
MTKKYSPSTKGFYSDDLHTTAQIPTDAVEVSDDLYTALFAAQSKGKVITMGTAGLPVAVDPATLLTPAQLSANLGRAVQSFINATAIALGYDNILAAISYADEAAVPKFQAEGVALRAWRSAVWAVATPALDAVTSGGTPPTAAALIATLPAFVPPTA